MCFLKLVWERERGEKERKGEERRERGRERNIHQLLPYTPRSGIEPTTFCVWEVTPTDWAPWPGQRLLPFRPKAVRGGKRESEWPTTVSIHKQAHTRKPQVPFILLGIWSDSYNNLLLSTLKTRGKDLLSYYCNNSTSSSKKWNLTS